ncbi:MAG TPA: hypothetical protein VGD84_18515 [Pseudonocardiaceae bacterium]
MIVSTLHGKVGLSGYAVVGPGCPIGVEVVGGQVSFDFGDNTGLTLVLQDEDVVEQFGNAWARASAQVQAWQVEANREE